MNHIILTSIAAGALSVLLTGPAAAEDVNRSTNTGATAASGFTAKNVNPIHPFGAINVYNVGVDPAQVSAWARKLSAGQKQEIVGRCSVIIQNQQNYYSETTNFCQNFAIAVAQLSAGAATPVK